METSSKRISTKPKKNKGKKMEAPKVEYIPRIESPLKLKTARESLETIIFDSPPCYLTASHTMLPIPLLSVDVKVNIVQSVASFEMIQKYVNIESHPIETLFYFPKDIESVFTKLTCEFTLQDGSKRFLETKIEEREKAVVKYEDAVASGKTAILGSFARMNKNMIKISIGQFPPMSRAIVKVLYFQQLEFEDMSYCLRIP